MKKTVVILFAILGVMLGTGLGASAGYPPGSTPKLTLSASTVTPGTTVTATITKIKPNATVKITFNGVTKTVTADSTGKAVLSLKAPANGGVYPVVAVVGTTVLTKNLTVKPKTTTTTTTVKRTTTTTIKPTTTSSSTSSTTSTTVAPGEPSLVVSASEVKPGGMFSASVDNAEPGSTVTFTFNGQTKTAIADENGMASVDFDAPTKPGKYEVRAVAGSSNLTKSITVLPLPTTLPPATSIPPTGSNTPTTGLTLGVPLLVGGLALLVVSRRRRPVGS